MFKVADLDEEKATFEAAIGGKGGIGNDRKKT